MSQIVDLRWYGIKKLPTVHFSFSFLSPFCGFLIASIWNNTLKCKRVVVCVCGRPRVLCRTVVVVSTRLQDIGGVPLLCFTFFFLFFWFHFATKQPLAHWHFIASSTLEAMTGSDQFSELKQSNGEGLFVVYSLLSTPPQRKNPSYINSKKNGEKKKN